MTKTIIDCRHIVKRFYIGKPNELEILHGIDLDVKVGEFVSIVGESGSGKSTLMNILGALDRPTEGTYYLNGVNVGEGKDKNLSEIRNRQIGFVFQTYNLIARTTALANDPAIILADEPTGALDSKTGRVIMDIFHKLHEEQGKTIVLITHSEKLANETQRIISLCDGNISGVRKGELAC